MTEKELFAHYRKTAPIEDLRFFLRATLSPDLRARAESYLPKGANKKQMAALRDAWRSESEHARRATGTPAIGSGDWYAEVMPEAAPCAWTRYAGDQWWCSTHRHVLIQAEGPISCREYAAKVA